MRWAVLVGGAGTNLQALLAAGCPISLVVSHRAGVKALDIAQEHGVPHAVLVAGDFASREQYDAALTALLTDRSIERVAMAGFLRWLTPEFTAQWGGRVLNLHPSLLPAYRGLHAVERAYRDGVLWSGVTVHFVDEGHDTGPIVAQIPVPRFARDSLSDFETRIHDAEHLLYPRVVQAVDQGEAVLSGGRVTYGGGDLQWMHGR